MIASSYICFIKKLFPDPPGPFKNIFFFVCIYQIQFAVQEIIPFLFFYSFYSFLSILFINILINKKGCKKIEIFFVNYKQYKEYKIIENTK